MKRLLVVLLASLVGVASAFAQALSPEETLTFVPGGHVSGAKFSLQTQFPSVESPYRKVLEIASGIGSNGRRLQVYFPYSQNGFVSGNVQQWLLVPAGRIYTYGPMTYNLVNVEHNRYIEATLEGGSIRCNEGTGNSLQRWYMTANNSAYMGFTLTNVASLQAITFNSSADGSPVTLSSSNGGINQCIVLNANLLGGNIFGINTYERHNIRSAANTTQIIALYGGSLDQNAVLGMWQHYSGMNDQAWNALSVETQTNRQDHFMLRNVKTLGKMGLDNDNLALGTYLRQRFASETTTEAVRWYWMPTKYSGQYYIVNATTGMAITANNWDTNNGSTVRQWPITGNVAQRWTVTKEVLP